MQNRLTPHMTATRQLPKITLTILLGFFSISSYSQDIRAYYQNTTSEKIKEANSIRFDYPDSARKLFLASIEKSLSAKDTSNVIMGIVGLSSHETHNANYAEAYDGYWKALLIANEANDTLSKALVYNSLGWLYSVFERRNEAIGYFNDSNILLKGIQNPTENNVQAVRDNYYALATLYRRSGDYQLASANLDSCSYYRSDPGSPDNAFVAVERAYILHEQGDYPQALQILQQNQEYFQQNHPSYLVMLHAGIADLYKAMGNYTQSEKYYKSSLLFSQKYKSHLNQIPEIYQNLSGLYESMSKYQDAFSNLKVSKELNDEQFGSTSETNLKILEIKDEFRIVQEENEKKLQAQKLAELEQREEINRLTSVILYGTIIFLVFTIFVSYRFLRNRYKARRKVLQKEKELQMQKSREILEIKNKELTASSLKLIEKDELLHNLKEQLNAQKTNPDENVIRKIVKSIDLNQSQNWEDFNARFVSVNHSFYDNLSKKFPLLSPGDKKICALIKLNFSSKDMSRLLGISVESVHTTRYRLRKKMGLERQDNLEERIAAI